ncbi:MAG: hypothetical protein ACLFPR_13080 [Desulfococcaceae bacterium]
MRISSSLARDRLEAQIFETVRGMSAGEDLVRYAKDNRIDHIFVGVEKNRAPKNSFWDRRRGTSFY